MRNRNYTKVAQREKFADRMEHLFMAQVKTLTAKELTEMFAFVSENLAKTHERFVYVRMRREFKVAVLRGEMLRRDAAKLKETGK